MEPDVSALLERAAHGDDQAPEQLLPLVYEELRRLARFRMTREAPGQTLQATALVHEAYLRLVRSEDARFRNRRHFFGAASQAMRRILIDRARRRGRIRHGGEWNRVPEDDVEIAMDGTPEEVLDLDEALTRMEERDPRRAEVVRLKFFIGLTIQEIAETLGVSPATVKLDWSYARAQLHRDLVPPPGRTPPPAAARVLP